MKKCLRSYRLTRKKRASAVIWKFGVRKLSTEIDRGYPNAFIASMKFRSSRYDIAALEQSETQRESNQEGPSDETIDRWRKKTIHPIDECIDHW